MAANESTAGIRLSALCPKFLHTNSTSHTWPFSAVAELIDNAYDPDVNAKQIWIDKTLMKGEICLTFTDNGNGMNQEKLHKMLSFGFSDKVAVNGHVPVGLYGNGFKSGSMRLGRDTIVFTKNDIGMCVGMLSQTYLETIKAEHVIVPIISFNKQRQLIKTPDSEANLNAILSHSLIKTEKELLAELDAILCKKGTRIIIWSLRKDKRGCHEFDFEKDKYDIRIPEEIDGTGKRGYKKQERADQIAPDSDYSLRAYCSILYLKPRMQIILRGQKVQTQLVSKSLAHIEKDVYRPKFMAPKTVKITFGYNCRNKEHYGIMMYHKNRLIKAYVKVGCQLKANNMGVGVVGVIECNFLKPTHNKQDFDYTNEYRLTLTALGEKLNDYWNEKNVKRDLLSVDPQNPNNLAVEDIKKNPDQVWVQCDSCLKWRKLPDGLGKLPVKWYCGMNADPQFRDCSVPEEPEDDDEITHSTYEKTYKKRKSEQLHQVFEKPTILFTPPSKELQPALKPMEPIVKPVHTQKVLNSSSESTTNGTKRWVVTEESPVQAKKSKVTESEPIEVPDIDDCDDCDEGDVIILEANSTPKPKSLKKENNKELCPVPLEGCADLETNNVPAMEDTSAVATQTEVAPLFIKKEKDTIDDITRRENQTSADVPVYSHCNGTGAHQENSENQCPSHQSPAHTAVQGKVNYKKLCEDLKVKMRGLEEQLTEMQNKEVKKEVSHQSIQTEEYPLNINGTQTKQLASLYEQALKEINRLKVQCETLQKLKSEDDAKGLKAAADNSESQVDEMAVQLDTVFRQLDASCTERDQYKKEVEQIKKENLQMKSRENNLKMEVDQMKAMVQQMNKDGASTSSMVISDDSLKLRTLRVNVAQLLTTLMPDLDLQQINYEVDVIDEILGQVLEQTEKQAKGTE
ncbi:MORC family CW-type zinc finger protein 3 [Bombina bombina]|uniref:MORC family CW-type zinc finger protein 3 n=1 Tax=Bombina bombina TaxID=8345 RepID=UPI00235AF20A|nr:MORC family CW-type zinc finger protein 3 [Bombina bombina]